MGFNKREQEEKRKNSPYARRPEDQTRNIFSPFIDLRKIVEEQNLKEGKRVWEKGQIDEAIKRFDQIKGLEKNEQYRSIASQCYYAYGKKLLGERNLIKASNAFKRSYSLWPLTDVNEKIKLIGAAIKYWEELSLIFSVSEFASKLRIVTKDTINYEPNRYLEYITSCPKISSILKIKTDTRSIKGRPVEIHILGYYQARPSNKWATLIREYKRVCDQKMALPLGILMVDYLFWEKKLLSQIDIAVPVAPDPAKYTQRGFGTTDQLASIVGQYTGIPTTMAILRTGGREFFFDEKLKTKISGRKILLIEDVVTTGDTLRKCCGLLFENGVLSVSGLVLGAASLKWFY